MCEAYNFSTAIQAPVFGGHPVGLAARFPEHAKAKGPKAKRVAAIEAPAVRADKAVKAFNTWSFKREQPSNPGLLAGVVTRAVAEARPIPFVLYWGKGPRAALDRPDTTCLDYLKSMADRVAEAHPHGAAIRLILTDTHAELNGHADAAVESYFAAVDLAARERGFTTVRLSEVVAAARQVAAIEVDDIPSGEVLESLVACAAKWYRGEGSTEDGALEYFRMNMVEKRAIEIVFPDAVFVTFNGGEFRDLFPADMPIFYMYSLRRGFGVKPWFMASDDGAAPAQETADWSDAVIAPSTRTAQ